MITCRELVEFLWKYLDHELDEEQRRKFDAHMAECPPCVAYMRTYGEAVTLTGICFDDPEAPAPDSVPEELVRAILDAR